MSGTIKKDDIVTIEGLNQSPGGKLWFNKSRKKRRVPLVRLKVIDVSSRIDTIIGVSCSVFEGARDRGFAVGSTTKR